MKHLLNDETLENDLQRIGRQILEKASKIAPSTERVNLFDRMVMDWVTHDEQLKTQLLRFIDAIPALRSAEEIAAHLREYLLRPDLPFPGIGRIGLDVASSNRLAQKAAASVIKANIVHLARRFFAGEKLPEVISTVRSLRKDHYTTTVDILGEATVSDEEAAFYEGQYLDLLNSLVQEAVKWKKDPLLDESGGELIPSTNVSVKLSSLNAMIDPSAPEESSQEVRTRLRRIMRQAKERNVAVNVDMEQYSLKDVTIKVFQDALEEKEFEEWQYCGIAMQAYLKDTVRDIERLIEWASQRNRPISIRLVRGAYWDYETIIARQRQWRIPVFTEKAATDQSYEKCLGMMIESYPTVKAAVATHNLRSIALAMALQERAGLPKNAIEFQMLYGMADPVKRVIADMGYRLRVYTPYGELLPGMAYLVRRLLENSSNNSMISLNWEAGGTSEEVLAVPLTSTVVEANEKERRFENEPDRDFAESEQREAFRNAIETVRRRLGGDYALWISNRPIQTGKWLVSVDPSHPKTVVGRVAAADTSQVDQGIKAAMDAFPAWRDAGTEKRTAILKKAASIIRQRRDELSAWEVFEAGKRWHEADADISECIDYLEYYSHCMEDIESERIVESYPGEENRTLYEPRGVVAVISPWNFPLAILTGMTVGALVTGNTVVLKPAPQTPVIGALFVQIMVEAGIPEGVLNYIPGENAVIGDYIVDHPNIAMIAFTGSRKIGERIYQRASVMREGQHALKHVIAEMGGKNALIIDSDADLDEVVSGVVASAFGYQGQKCSACSRVICVGSVYEPFLKRLIEATKSLPIGPADNPYHRVGPVIDATAMNRIRDTIEKGKKEAKVALEIPSPDLDGGYYVGPVIFRDVNPNSFIAQEEIFGPALCVIPVKDIEHAVKIGNQTAYGLTGGVYSRSPSNIDYVCREFRVGNLYVNRKITGALVGRQPFGGYKMSGTGSKAGGPDYLKHFMVMRVITENTIRRGFAPETMTNE